MKLSIYVWGCKSQGVEADLKGLFHLHQVQPQPQKMDVDGQTVLGQFGVYTFVYRHGVEVLVQA